MDLNELGVFLKSRRARVRPRDVGLATGPRRRVPGLRRDEVAGLAGASVEYYVELEQGRGAQPSERMLAVLARALRLTGDERDHLYYLAGRQLPPVHGTPTDVNPAMRDLLDRMPHTPAQVITDLSAPLLQNRMAATLLGPAPRAHGIGASFVYQWFTDPESRQRYHHEEHAHQSAVFVADVRAVAARRGTDPEIRRLVTTLQSASDEFARLWDRREVAVRRSDRKRLIHPDVGEIELNCLSLLSEDGTQRLLWFTAPPGSDAIERLRAATPTHRQHAHLTARP